MPKFVIERQYLVPIYQHIVIEAETFDAACEMAVTDDASTLDAALGSARAERFHHRTLMSLFDVDCEGLIRLVHHAVDNLR